MFKEDRRSVVGALTVAAIGITVASLLSVGWLFASLAPDAWPAGERSHAGTRPWPVDRSEPLTTGSLAREAASIAIAPCGEPTTR